MGRHLLEAWVAEAVGMVGMGLQEDMEEKGAGAAGGAAVADLEVVMETSIRTLYQDSRIERTQNRQS
jgi:hypothetical protein